MKAFCVLRAVTAIAFAHALLIQLAFGQPLPNAWRITDNTTATSTTFYYTNRLTLPLQVAATNSGFRFAVNARFVDDFDTGETMTMVYGLGNKRFLIYWDLDSNTNLTARLEGGPSYTLTTNGTGNVLYHTHEIIFTNDAASYLFDGMVKTNNWAGSGIAWPAGAITWGAGSSSSRGQMNFNRVIFQVTNAVVAEYYAGTSPAIAPNPTNSGWVLFPSVLPSGASVTNISPDTTLLPVATTLPADQFTNNSARLNGQVSPRGSPAMAWFEWGTDTNYGNVIAVQDVGQGVTLSNITTVLNGLVGGLPHHYRLMVSNGYGVAVGFNQSFTLAGFYKTDISSLPGVSDSSVAWGDYDKDGRLDFLLTGNQHGLFGVSRLMRNTGSGFTNVTTTVVPDLPEVRAGSVAWGDYDNDGWLDFVLAGFSQLGAVSQMWRNTGNGFTHVPVPGLMGVHNGSVAWGDYDNDGRLDFLLTGRTNSQSSARISQLWRNTGSGFSNVPVPGLTGLSDSFAAWGDYDNDGRLDFLITGYDGASARIQLWRNTGNGFSNLSPNLKVGTPVDHGCVAWGDYNDDGRGDILLTGHSSNGAVSELLHNTGSGFTNVPVPGLTAVSNSFVAWGDYDNDGRLDFLLTGAAGAADVSQLWRNTSSGFSNVTTSILPGLTGIEHGSVAWGDYDNDGRLDLLLTGSSQSQLWRNNLPISNAPPSAPTGLSATLSGDGVTLQWNAPTDDLTPATGLTYNVRIGSTPGGSDVLAPMALSNGLRLLPAHGNVLAGTNAFLRLPQGPTYWSVQALDASFAGSPFAAEQQFVIAPSLINPIRFPGGFFEFNFTNLTSWNFDVLVSTNVALPLGSWSNLGPALHLGAGYYRFTDAGAIGQSRRYYILRSQ